MTLISSDSRIDRLSISTVSEKSAPINDARMIRHVRAFSFSRRSAVISIR